MNIIDIAKLCGLSKSTVSRYLTGGSVSAKSAEKIARVIEQTGFEANVSASRLKTNRSNLVGVLIDGIESTSIARTISGINDRCRENGYLPFVVFNRAKQDASVESIRTLIRQGVDGIIFGTMGITNEQRSYLRQCGKPVLVLGQRDEEFHYCTVDDQAAGFMLGKHVRDIGARKVAYLSYPHANRAIGVERTEGFLSAFDCESHPDEPSQVSVIESSYAYIDDVTPFIEQAFRMDPDCIVAASDRIAFKVLESAAAHGIHIPQDCMLAGFGNNPADAIPSVSLTSIDFDYQAMGRHAAAQIIALIQGDEVPRKSTDYAITLIERGSTKR